MYFYFFCISFAAPPEAWTEDKPFTDCPRVHDAMDSGEVVLKSLKKSTLKEGVSYRYDCIWQIKPHYGDESIKTYVKLLNANLVDGELALPTEF